MRIFKPLLGLTLLASMFILIGCHTSPEASMVKQRAAQEHLRKVCSEHYAHIQGLNDGRYGRKSQSDYARVTGCPSKHAVINEGYLDGFQYAMVHK
jgi:hypothetical protein